MWPKCWNNWTFASKLNGVIWGTHCVIVGDTNIEFIFVIIESNYSRTNLYITLFYVRNVHDYIQVKDIMYNCFTKSQFRILFEIHIGLRLIAKIDSRCTRTERPALIKFLLFCACAYTDRQKNKFRYKINIRAGLSVRVHRMSILSRNRRPYGFLPKSWLKYEICPLTLLF